jgi:hypothetical protein
VKAECELNRHHAGHMWRTGFEPGSMLYQAASGSLGSKRRRNVTCRAAMQVTISLKSLAFKLTLAPIERLLLSSVYGLETTGYSLGIIS